MLRGDLYGYLKDPDGIRLVRFSDGRLDTVAGWPQDRIFFGLTIHHDHLYAIVRGEGGAELWRTDGKTSERASVLAMNAVDLASDGSHLWAVSRDGNLWSSQDGARWKRRASLSGG